MKLQTLAQHIVTALYGAYLLWVGESLYFHQNIMNGNVIAIGVMLFPVGIFIQFFVELFK